MVRIRFAMLTAAMHTGMAAVRIVPVARLLPTAQLLPGMGVPGVCNGAVVRSLHSAEDSK